MTEAVTEKPGQAAATAARVSTSDPPTDGARGKLKASARPTSNKKAQKKGEMADDADG